MTELSGTETMQLLADIGESGLPISTGIPQAIVVGKLLQQIETPAPRSEDTSPTGYIYFGGYRGGSELHLTPKLRYEIDVSPRAEVVGRRLHNAGQRSQIMIQHILLSCAAPGSDSTWTTAANYILAAPNINFVLLKGPQFLTALLKITRPDFDAGSNQNLTIQQRDKAISEFQALIKKNTTINEAATITQSYGMLLYRGSSSNNAKLDRVPAKSSILPRPI